MNGEPADPRDIEIVDVKKNADGKRVYVVEDHEGEDSGEYVSVTSKLSETVPKGEQFYRWLGNAESYRDTQQYMKKRGKIGTEVHEICEKKVTGEEYNLDAVCDEVNAKVSGFDEWVVDHEPEFIDAEFIVFCREFNYAGRCDLLAKIDGDRVLIDIKTSKGIYDSHKLQLMLYRYGLEEGGVDIDKCAVLRLMDYDYDFVEVDYHPELVRAQNVFYDWLSGNFEDVPTLEVE